jgi:hypothetical protein
MNDKALNLVEYQALMNGDRTAQKILNATAYLSYWLANDVNSTEKGKNYIEKNLKPLGPHPLEPFRLKISDLPRELTTLLGEFGDQEQYAIFNVGVAYLIGHVGGGANIFVDIKFEP